MYDQRASGRSSLELVPESVTLDNFIQDIEGLRKQMQVEKLTLLAHSWGGILAMKYAFWYPKRVNALILVNSIGASSELNNQMNPILARRFTQDDSLARVSLRQSQAFQERQPEAREALMKLGFWHQFYEGRFWDSLDLALTETYGESSRLPQYLGQGLLTYDFYPELTHIKAPTYCLYGTFDPLTVLVATSTGFDSQFRFNDIRDVWAFPLF